MLTDLTKNSLHAYLLNDTAVSLGVIFTTIFSCSKSMCTFEAAPLTFPITHMVAECILTSEVMVTYSTTNIRSLFKLSWSHECTGTSGSHTVFLVASTERISLSQRSWQQPLILYDGVLPPNHDRATNTRSMKRQCLLEFNLYDHYTLLRQDVSAKKNGGS